METICAKCGAENLKESNFCARCGSKIVEKKDDVCTKCGKKTEVGQKFCGNCGTKTKREMSEEQKTSSPEELGAADYYERKRENLKKDVEFFCIPFSKLLILTVATLGIYMAYWLYKNWKAEHERDEDTSPFWRTIFAFIFNYSLFKRILESAEKQGYKTEYSAGLLYSLQIIGFVLGKAETSDLLLIIGLVLYFFPIYIIQQAIEFNNSKINPNSYKKNFKFTDREILVTVIMGLIFLNAIFGG